MGERRPNACGMPDEMPGLEAELYGKLRSLHCARKAASHDCRGAVTLDRLGMTLRCRLCGDARRLYPKAS